MYDDHNIETWTVDLIRNPVGIVAQFPNVGVVDLWHHFADVGKGGNAVGVVLDLLHRLAGIVVGILGDKRMNVLQLSPGAETRPLRIHLTLYFLTGQDLALLNVFQTFADFIQHIVEIY